LYTNTAYVDLGRLESHTRAIMGQACGYWQASMTELLENGDAPLAMIKSERGPRLDDVLYCTHEIQR
jgi:hypothetical protein